MATGYVGYAALVEKYGLRCLPHYRVSEISTAAKGQQLVSESPPAQYRFEPSYKPEETLVGQIEFALKYEGVSLEILKALFQKTGPAEIEAWLKATPNSQFARRAGFLYEWLTDKHINIHTPASATYVDALSADDYIVSRNPQRNTRFKVNNNFLGTAQFCPLVRNTDRIKAYAKSDIPGQIKEIIQSKSKQLIERAVAFLYLSETQYSFKIEGEKPSPQKAQRFADLLARTGTIPEITEDVLLDVHRLVIHERSMEASYRTKQNWVGDSLGEYRKRVEYIPPAPGDLHGIMDGLLSYLSNAIKNPSDVVAAAAVVSFGFVYAHPFLDGNGRIHRFLIHYVLEHGGFTPKNTIIPASVAIYSDREAYRDILNLVSKQITQKIDVNWIDGNDEISVKGNDADFYRYFDATHHAEYLYGVVEKAATQDLAHEIEFLISFEQARKEINDFIDLPTKELNLLVRCVIDQKGTLSKSKRDGLFPQLSADEITKAEEIVRENFPNGFDKYAELKNTSNAARLP